LPNEKTLRHFYLFGAVGDAQREPWSLVDLTVSFRMFLNVGAFDFEQCHSLELILSVFTSA